MTAFLLGFSAFALIAIGFLAGAVFAIVMGTRLPDRAEEWDGYDPDDPYGM